MEQLAARRGEIDHLVIETSGLALPKTPGAGLPVAADPQRLHRGRRRHRGRRARRAGRPVAEDPWPSTPSAAPTTTWTTTPLAELFEDQLATADLVVLNKIEGLDADAVAQVEALVRAETPAGVQLIHATEGRVAPEVLLGQGRAVET